MSTIPARVSLFRKMSLAEAEKTFAEFAVQPPQKGSHSLKHFSTSLEKVQAFRNKAVTAPETIIEIQIESSKFEEMTKGAVRQEKASRFPDKVQISTEGLTEEEIVSGHVNVGIPPSLLETFNQAILFVKELR